MVFLAAAVLLPMAHGQYAANRESQSVGHFSSTRQYVKAWSHVVALESMAGVQATIGAAPPSQFMSSRSEDGRPSDLVRSNLVTSILAQTAAIRQPLPPNVGVADAIRRAETLVSLNRLDEAVQLLESLEDRRPDALLVLATVYEEQRNSAKAVEILKEAAGAIGNAKGDDVESIVRVIYQRLAQNLRMQQRYGEAEACLFRAIEQYDHSHGFFFFELGLHCKMGGRFQQALGHYQSCVEADARYGDRVDKAVMELRLNTPACILRPVKTVTR